MELFEKFELSAQGLSYSGHRLSDDVKYESNIGSSAKPLYIHTDSDTDWAALSPSIAGVVVAIIVAWLTVRVQKNQIKANLSNFRSQWMSELRACGSEYLMAMLDMAVNTEMEPEFYKSGQHFQAYRQVVALGIKFDLLLTGDDEDATKLRNLESETALKVLNMKLGADSQPVIDNINNLKGLLRVELESAWTDIKKDVGKTK
ncbi:hypothetical protein J3D47_004172 [Pseudomonas laurylsulfativorans]|uniref:hypothetical protein n=1 Tax=Pseudomonas laurylsulfativorans TaxID=1943631 RepID=UPI00209E517D|nr:hypothetical protein [Pseudomonas laurylsulfativorans]MCP1419929.1 hypothetical protein [Pseudomonas laurylsulfativorans]